VQLAIVIGHATSTIKHRALAGWRMTLVQPVGVTRQPEGDPIIAVDAMGSGLGQTVVLNTDGKAARELLKDEKSPVRYFVIAIVDQQPEETENQVALRPSSGQAQAK
jgi:microcompartment protein CcmK/EutM